jgi:general secretion pathway protein C
VRGTVAFDALLKKCFPLLVLVLVAAAAYWQAHAAIELLGWVLIGDTPAPSASHGHASDPAKTQVRLAKSARHILSRNVFDSVTGPLEEPPMKLPEQALARLEPSDRLAAPPCDGVRAQIVTESPDAEWSLAALQDSEDPTPKLRRVGDKVMVGKQIAYIGYNPRKNSPSVWITGESALCQVLLFSPANAATRAATPAEPAGPHRHPSPLSPEIASRIRKVGDTEFNVDRAVVERILENPAELMSSVRIVPEQKDGKVVGIRLFGVRPDTLLGALGLQNGDRLESINGLALASPEELLEAYARLRTLSSLNLTINRRGQSTTLDYYIK